MKRPDEEADWSPSTDQPLSFRFSWVTRGFTWGMSQAIAGPWGTKFGFVLIVCLLFTVSLDRSITDTVSSSAWIEFFDAGSTFILFHPCLESVTCGAFRNTMHCKNGFQAVSQVSAAHTHIHAHIWLIWRVIKKLLGRLVWKNAAFFCSLQSNRERGLDCGWAHDT